MIKKIIGFVLSVTLFALNLSAEAQQPGKIPRIGYVSGTGDVSNQGPYVEALRQGLRDLGYVERKNLVIDYRGAEGKLDRIPSLRSLWHTPTRTFTVLLWRLHGRTHSGERRNPG